MPEGPFGERLGESSLLPLAMLWQGPSSGDPDSPGVIMFHILKRAQGASLVVQWLRIRLPMQGTRVRALVSEDPTCRGATGPVSHNY